MRDKFESKILIKQFAHMRKTSIFFKRVNSIEVNASGNAMLCL